MRKPYDDIIIVKADQYIAHFYKMNKKGKYFKFNIVGNTGVALDFVKMLRNLGHLVTVDFQEVQDV